MPPRLAWCSNCPRCELERRPRGPVDRARPHPFVPRSPCLPPPRPASSRSNRSASCSRMTAWCPIIRCRSWSTRPSSIWTAPIRRPTSRACSPPMAGATCGATASTTMCTIMRPCMRRWVSPAERRGSASAAIRARSWSSGPATSPSCRPALGINASLPAAISASSAPIRPDRRCRSRGRRRKTARALKTIPEVPMPATDPVLGAGGPLTRLWQQAR